MAKLPRVNSFTVLGHTINQSTYQRVANECSIPLFDESWVLATAGAGSVWAALWSVALLIPSSDGAPPLLVTVFAAGAVGILIGGWLHSRYRRLPRTDSIEHRRELHRLVGYHRLHATALLTIFGAGAIIHMWKILPQLGVLTTLLMVCELVAAYRYIPFMLRFIAGESRRATTGASIVDLLSIILIGLAASSAGFPLLLQVAPSTILASCMMLISSISTPWIIGLIAVALVHFQVADTLD